MITSTKNKFYTTVLAAALIVSVLFMDGIDASAASAVPKQYESVFNAEYYAARYPDLAAVLGNDEAALFNHYITSGIAEGRVGTGGVPVAADIVAASGLAEAKAGSVVTFGSYEQDNDPANGKEPIEWHVLSKSDGQMLLLSAKILDSQIYGTYGDVVLWETCGLRSWLNNDFYNEAFSAVEKTLVADSYVVNANNRNYDTEAGNDTVDKVFCLSLGELETYFHIDSRNMDNMAWGDYNTYCYNQDHRILAAPTEYARAQKTAIITPGAIKLGFYKWDASYAIGCGNWWLRSPGYSTTYASRVDAGAGADALGRSVSFTQVGVRPALRVRYE